jgi:hypothetical protein
MKHWLAFKFSHFWCSYIRRVILSFFNDAFFVGDEFQIVLFVISIFRL